MLELRFFTRLLFLSEPLAYFAVTKCILLPPSSCFCMLMNSTTSRKDNDDPMLTLACVH